MSLRCPACRWIVVCDSGRTLPAPHHAARAHAYEGEEPHAAARNDADVMATMGTSPGGADGGGGPDGCEVAMMGTASTVTPTALVASAVVARAVESEACTAAAVVVLGTLPRW